MKKYYFSLFLSLLFWGIWVGEGSLAPIQEDEGNILMPPSDTLTFWAQNFSFFGSGYYQTMGRLRATGNFAYIYTQEDTSSIVSLALNPNDPNRIFSAIADAGAGSGDEVFFYWTSDGSDNWNSSDMILFEYDPPIRALISHPTSSTSLRLFAATSRGVYSSTNQGVSWTAYNQDSLVGREILALTKSPYGISTNYTLYAGAFNGIWKRLSTSGQKWMRMPTTGLTDSIALSISSDPVNPDTVYIGTARGFFMWSPGGSNWIPLNNGLTDTFIQTITIDPIDGSRILVGTPSGVFLTSDGGSNWALKINGITNTDIRAIAIDPNSPGTLYAGTWGGGVFKSTDSGDNWVEKNSGFPIHRFGHFVSSLVVDPLSSNNLYAGTKRGIFKSSDGGSTWIEKNFGLLKTSFKDEIMDSLIEVFDNRIPADPSKGIYETSVNLLGTPPNVDGDSLIYIFVLDIKDLQGDGSQGSYNGYFDPVNQDTSHPFSNRKEILYLDAFPQDVSTLEAHQSLTHQFALMVHWNADSNEEKWVTEGVANYSEFKHGYVDTNASFLYPSGNSLNFWGDGTASAKRIYHTSGQCISMKSMEERTPSGRLFRIHGMDLRGWTQHYPVSATSADIPRFSRTGLWHAISISPILLTTQGNTDLTS